MAKRAGVTTTSIALRDEDLRLLKAVAYKRALDEGAKPSVSGVITDLVERCREELQDEAGNWR